MDRYQIDLDQYEADFTELTALERDAMSDLARVENLESWEPTNYERYYIPQLRLAGIRNKDEVALQNTADLHLHTQWSDGDDLDKVLDQALDMKLDAIAITDHSASPSPAAATRTSPGSSEKAEPIMPATRALCHCGGLCRTALRAARRGIGRRARKFSITLASYGRF